MRVAWLDTENQRSVAVVFLATLLFAVLAVASPPLGHDESVYALGGYELTHDALVPYPLHRPVAMRLVAAPAAVSSSDLDLRLVPVAITGLFLMLLLRLGGKRIGVTTALVVGTSWVVCRRGATLGSDVPAAALLLGAMLMIGTGCKSGRARRWMMLTAAPLAAAAIYVRYASISSVAVIAIAAAIAWRHQWRALLAPALATAALCALLLVPLALYSHLATGSPIGIFERAAHEAGRTYIGDGLRYYATTWWWRDVGPVATVFMLLGLLAWLRRREPIVSFCVLAALGMIAATGIASHGEARYALLPLGLLVHAGAVFSREVITDGPLIPYRHARPLRLVLAVACAASFVVGAMVPIQSSSSALPFSAAQRIADLSRAARTPCRVLTESKWQIGWYAECRAFEDDSFDFADVPTLAALRPADVETPIGEMTRGWRIVAITPGYVIVANDSFVARLR
ncbi:MAG TPA: hypothetical protein VGM39_11425 [Kofleriaceae bacterium]|jgi:hypothetical protein